MTESRKVFFPDISRPSGLFFIKPKVNLVCNPWCECGRMCVCVCFECVCISLATSRRRIINTSRRASRGHSESLCDSLYNNYYFIAHRARGHFAANTKKRFVCAIKYRSLMTREIRPGPRCISAFVRWLVTYRIYITRPVDIYTRRPSRERARRNDRDFSSPSLRYSAPKIIQAEQIDVERKSPAAANVKTATLSAAAAG